MAARSPYRFAARPKWIAGHLLALAAIVGFVNLGLWQLSRHDERSEVNRTIAARAEEPVTLLGDLIAAFGEDPTELEYRTVRVRGTYLLDEEVIWQARTLDGVSGHDVLTPLAVNGRAVIVDRGWVPIDAGDPPVAGAQPTSLDSTVTGVIRPGRTREGLGPIDPGTGDLDRISRVDLGRLQQQIGFELYPFYVLLVDQSPAQTSRFPLPQDPPEVDPGPHLSYAVQWFVFAVIAAVGYPVLLRRTARDEKRAATASGETDDDAPYPA